MGYSWQVKGTLMRFINRGKSVSFLSPNPHFFFISAQRALLEPASLTLKAPELLFPPCCPWCCHQQEHESEFRVLSLFLLDQTPNAIPEKTCLCKTILIFSSSNPQLSALWSSWGGPEISRQCNLAKHMQIDMTLKKYIKYLTSLI